MFEALSDRLQGIVKGLTGQARLTPDNIRDSLREVRRALLEADVQVGVARDFIARVEARAVGDDVLKSLTPGQQVVGIVRDELESLLGKTPVTLAAKTPSDMPATLASLMTAPTSVPTRPPSAPMPRGSASQLVRSVTGAGRVSLHPRLASSAHRFVLMSSGVTTVPGWCHGGVARVSWVPPGRHEGVTTVPTGV